MTGSEERAAGSSVPYARVMPANRWLRADVLHRLCAASVAAFLALLVLRTLLGQVAVADDVVEAVDAAPASAAVVAVLFGLVMVTALAWLLFVVVEVVRRRRG